MFCIKCGNKIEKKDNFCLKCDPAILEKNNNKQNIKTFFGKGTFVVFLIFVMVVSAVIARFGTSSIIDYFQSESSHKQTTEMVKNVYEDASKGTNKSSEENQKYVEIISSIMSYYSNESSKLLSAYEKIENSDVLEYSSFESENNMMQLVEDISDYKNQLNNYYANLDKVINRTKDLVMSSELSDEDKGGLISGFEKVVNDVELTKLRIEYIDSLKKHTDTVLDLYNFLINNYYDYEIGMEGLEENIYFYSDSNILEYNNYIELIDKYSNEFIFAQNNYYKRGNEIFDEFGLDMTVQEAEEYFN